MKNELQIKPLRKYEVEYGEGIAEVFTADTMLREEDGSIIFQRTGNVIRVYTPYAGVRVVIVTPADDDEA
jgi:hypothetical protein